MTTDIIAYDDAPDTEMVFRAPDKQSKGYLRRVRQSLAFKARVDSGEEVSIGLIDEMIVFLLPYIVEPRDRTAAREALLDASQDQYLAMLTAVQGGGTDAEPDPLPTLPTGA